MSSPAAVTHKAGAYLSPCLSSAWPSNPLDSRLQEPDLAGYVMKDAELDEVAAFSSPTSFFCTVSDMDCGRTWAGTLLARKKKSLYFQHTYFM
jgi:hypothetical protein